MPSRHMAVWGLLSASILSAQDFRATLTGRVLDAGGAAVSRAKVRVTNAARAESRETLTDDQGNYQVPLLNPAIYSVSVEAEGFKLTKTNEDLPRQHILIFTKP